MIESKMSPLEWVQLNPTGTTPGSRSGHTITGMGRMSIMFGGIDPAIKKNGKMFPNNQVYTVKVVKDNIEWRQVQCGGDVPLERTNHAACAISQEKLFIFGGFYTSNLRFNDVYILKTSTFLIQPTSTGNSPPTNDPAWNPRTPSPKSAPLSPEPTALPTSSKTRSSSSEATEEWATKELPTTMSTSSTARLPSGPKSRSKEEPLPTPEEATRPSCSPRKNN